MHEHDELMTPSQKEEALRVRIALLKQKLETVISERDKIAREQVQRKSKSRSRSEKAAPLEKLAVLSKDIAGSAQDAVEVRGTQSIQPDDTHERHLHLERLTFLMNA